MLYLKFVPCAMICAVPLAVFAAHPLTTEDTDEIGGGNSQIETTFDRDVARSTHLSTEVAKATFTQGITDAFEVALTTPWMARERDDSPRVTYYGLGDTSVFLKLRVYQQDKFAFVMKEETIFPTGNQEKGLCKDRVQTAVNGVFSWGDQHLDFLGNVGYFDNRNKDDQRRAIVTASGAARLRLTEHWRVVTEIASHSNYSPDSAKYQSMGGIGVIFSPIPSLDLDVGYHHGLNRESTLYSFGAGAAYRW